MNTPPRITVGIPFFNAQDTLRAAIHSVLAQTFEDWELLLVDDGSRDNSLLIARSFENSRIKLLTDNQNRGLVARLNQIARTARGQYVARMDADDIMHPDRLAKQVRYLDQNPSVDVVGSWAYEIDGQGIPYGLRTTELKPDAAAVLESGLFIHPTVTGKRDWFINNPYNPEFIRCEDRELWVRTFELSKFDIIREPLLFYREHDRFRIEAYLASRKSNRRLFLQRGPALVGWRRTLTLTAKNHAQAALFKIASSSGLANRLIRLRGVKISPGQRREAEAALARVRVNEPDVQRHS